MQVSRSIQGLPGNWFIDGDGTCGTPPESQITSQQAFIGFFFLNFILAIIAGCLNFIPLIQKVKEGKLFKHGVYKRTIIDVVASVVAPIMAATLFKQDDDVYTMHNLHVVFWVVLFGFRPGALMGLMQVFGNGRNSAAAAGQMIANMIFPLFGCLVALGSENGSVVPVAYGWHRSAVFVGVGFVSLHLASLLIIYFVWRLGGSHTRHGDQKYRVFMGITGRTCVFFLGILSVVGSSILLVVGSQMCGKFISFIDAMCQLAQAILSAILAAYVSRVGSQGNVPT